jgi:DNA polymerase-4
VELGVGLAVGAGAEAVGEEAPGFVAADGAAAGADHVTCAGVDLDGRLAGADADFDDPFRRPRPALAAVFGFCRAAFQRGDLRVDAVQPQGMPHPQDVQSVQVGRQIIEHIFDSRLKIEAPRPRVFDFMFDNVVEEVSTMRTRATVGGQGVVMHVRCADRLPEETYRQVLEELAGLSPVVQALPPTAALVDLRGALRFHGVGARRLGEVLRVRTVSRLGTDVRIGIGPSITIAATASGQVLLPGGVLAVAPEDVTGWLGPLPVEALHGIGPRQAAVLRDYGIHCVRLLAAVPPATVQRLLGGRAGRLAADRARGIDPRPVVPRALPATASVRHRFDEHTLDGADVRAALLDLVVRLGTRLRGRGQAARALTLTLKFTGGSSWEKTRRLKAPSAHEDDLRRLAYQLMDAAGLQRGRLTGLTLKGEDLVDADQAPRQLSLDDSREARLAAETAVDRVRDKFGPQVIGPAAVFRRAS